MYVFFIERVQIVENIGNSLHLKFQTVLADSKLAKCRIKLLATEFAEFPGPAVEIMSVPYLYAHK